MNETTETTEHQGEPLVCFAEYEAWGPHPGCAEFMDGPEHTWNCDKKVVGMVVCTDAHAQYYWDKYGPWTQEEIDRSEGYLSYPTYTIFACEEHLPYATEEDPGSITGETILDEIYVERF